jgi:S1-C subfamily serine protease
MVRLVVQSALQGGKVQRPWFGASLQAVTSDLADSLGLDRPGGALVKDLHMKGPAARAGLRAGDVVVSVDGKEIKDPQAFNYRFATKGIGGEAELVFKRQGKPFRVTVPLVGAIEDPPRDLRDLSGRHPLAGARVANLSPAVAEEMGIEARGGSGVIVIEVEAGTPAARLGVRRGDIVIGVNEDRVTSVEVLVAALTGAVGGWRLSLERDGRVYSLAIQG